MDQRDIVVGLVVISMGPGTTLSVEAARHKLCPERETIGCQETAHPKDREPDGPLQQQLRAAISGNAGSTTAMPVGRVITAGPVDYHHTLAFAGSAQIVGSPRVLLELSSNSPSA